MSRDSDNDEGFVAAKVEINEEEQSITMEKSNPNRFLRPQDYQARHIFG